MQSLYPLSIYFLLIIFFLLHFSIPSVISMQFLYLSVYMNRKVFKIKYFYKSFLNVEYQILNIKTQTFLI